MESMIIASTRPEVIKLSPVMRRLEGLGLDCLFITTGQHYDRNLFQTFIEELRLKKPDYDIEIGSGSQAYQTSSPMIRLEEIMLKERPDAVVIEGDTNSVLSSALTALKLKIPVAHVEAGLRSFDRTMPEEINRTLTDHCSEVLFAPTETSALNLINEGIFPNKIFVVGNTIVDATLQNLEIAKKESKILQDLPESYLLLTLHRTENVDDRKRLEGIVNALVQIDEEIVFPIHPRTKKMLENFGLLKKLEKKIRVIEPLGYLDFLVLMSNAKIVLTDSGGVQEEAIILNVPCITLRLNTERPETVEAGGNILAGVEGEAILEKVDMVLNDATLYKKMKEAKNPFGDGATGKRIVKILTDLRDKGKLKVDVSDFTEGFWKREFLTVNSKLNGKRIGELNFTVLKVIEDGEERFPFEDFRLKNGQMIEILK